MTEKRKWYRLDNASTPIPATTGGASTRVFRIVCELKEEVDPVILQNALDRTIWEYPFFNVVLRKGLFWYYLDESDLHVQVHEDDLAPCAALYQPGRRNLLYRLTYFHKRINLEMFHVLADGTGALQFFRRLIVSYLEEAHGFTCSSYGKPSTIREREEDAFKQFYEKTGAVTQLKKATAVKAYQLMGSRDENFENHLMEVHISASAFIQKAHEYNVTAGILSTALYIQAVLAEMPLSQRRKPVVVSVPVNLRQYFHSNTARNFYGTVNIPFYADEYDGTIQSIMKVVEKEFHEKLSEDAMRENMNSYSAMEHHAAVRPVPLFIKDTVVAHYYRKAADCVTGTVSNLGRIKMPEETCPYIDSFSAFMAKSNMQVCVASFMDQMTFGFCTDRTDTTVMHHFCNALTEMGMEVTIACNDREDE